MTPTKRPGVLLGILAVLVALAASLTIAAPAQAAAPASLTSQCRELLAPMKLEEKQKKAENTAAYKADLAAAKTAYEQTGDRAAYNAAKSAARAAKKERIRLMAGWYPQGWYSGSVRNCVANGGTIGGDTSQPAAG
jgi:hypothetical protein